MNCTIFSYHSNDGEAGFSFRRGWRHQSCADCARGAGGRRRGPPSEQFVFVLDDGRGRIGADIARLRKRTLGDGVLFPQRLQPGVHVERGVVTLRVAGIHGRCLAVVRERYHGYVLYDVRGQRALRSHGGRGRRVSPFETPHVAQRCR